MKNINTFSVDWGKLNITELNKFTLNINFENQKRISCIIKNPYIITLFVADRQIKEAIEYDYIGVHTEDLRYLDNDYKKKAFLKLRIEFGNGYLKGLKRFKKEKKRILNPLYLSDLERLKKEFDFYYNEKIFSVDNKKRRKHTISLFILKHEPISFSELDVYNWGYLTAIENKLFEFANEKPNLVEYTDPVYSIRPETIAKKMDTIWVKIKYRKIQKISYDFEIIKHYFLEVKNLFQSLKTNHFKVDEVKELKNEILEALEIIKNDLDTTDQKTFILNLINEFNQSQAKPQPQPLNYNINHFNENSFLLFQYLIDNYIELHKKRQKVKFMNIWFFLKELDDPKYLFCPTKDEYKILIKKEYNIEITNTDKPQNYIEKQLPKLKNHKQVFESS